MSQPQLQRESSRPSRSETWKKLLYDNLRDSARPLFIFRDTTIPAASVWTGARKWIESFRSYQLQAGDRLVVSMPPGPEFVQVLVASIWMELSVFILPDDKQQLPNPEVFDAAGFITGPGSSVSYESTWRANGLAGPDHEPESTRTTVLERTPSIRFWLQSSGTTGESPFYGLSDTNLLSVLSSHAEVLDDVDTLLSYLPWDHCFGLVFDCLYSLLERTILVRDPFSVQDPSHTYSLIDSYEVDQINTVPVIVERLAEHSAFRWNQLEEGIVGGAPITGKTAERLRGTNLRVGYGQTEASPGITLGESGNFPDNFLGSPVNCELKLSKNDEIIFEGLNAHRSLYDPDERTIRNFDVPRPVTTGDLGSKKADGYYFKGRKDHRIKLPNGTFLDPHHVESRLRSRFSSEFVLTRTNSNQLALHVYRGNPKSDRVRSCFRDEFGDLEEYLTTVTIHPSESAPRNQKGEIDRLQFTGK